VPAAPNVPKALLDPSAEAAIDAALIKRLGLYQFVKRAWNVVNPGIPFTPGWHLELICAHLEAVSRGEITRLILNVPPGASKSTITSVFWPAYDWITHPQRRWMAATFDERLAGRDTMACRRLIKSKWYQDRFGDLVSVDESGESQSTQEIWNLKQGGRRYSTTVAGGATGWHADVQLVDDPVKPSELLKSDPEIARNSLERCWTWFTGTMASRRTGANFARVIICQRLHELDLVGRILEMDATGEWVKVILPMRFERDRACATPWGHDPRREDGELLCPARWDEKAVAELEREMGSQVAAAQLQQRPAPAGGNVFQRTWFEKRWMRAENPKWKDIPTSERDRYVVLPKFFSGAISADCTFKDTAGADFVAIQAWGESGSNFYLIDQIFDRMGLPQTERCIEAMAARWPWARAKLIEDKANGPAVEQTLRKKMSGIVMITPEGGKVARANAISPLCESGNVILPDESEYDWVGTTVEELVTFPFARHDDRVDAMTQALTYLHARNMGRYLEAMQNVGSGRVGWTG